jgi:hypothetical protein
MFVQREEKNTDVHQDKTIPKKDHSQKAFVQIGTLISVCALSVL